jgi:UDP-galactopyranose mutase
MSDLLVVGAGLYGLTVAERAANELGLHVTIIDKRHHIGGNAYSSFDAATGIEVHRYGAHLFHTSNERVWEYANRFTAFTNYVHRVYTVHGGTVYPMPVNLGTINQFFGTAMGPDEARAFIASQTARYGSCDCAQDDANEARALIASQPGEFAGREPQNLLEKGISLVGRPLFEAFFAGYTANQWQTPLEQLPPSIISRLPVRYTYDNRYFSDTHEGLPADGYAKWFERMVDNPRITVKLDVDFFATDGEFTKTATVGQTPVVYTGPIDRYFDHSAGNLAWRTIDLLQETLPTADFQGIPVMNYADLDVPFTRIIEFRHFHPERSYASDATLIHREYSRFAQPADEPYYPVNTPTDQAVLSEYRQLAKAEPNVHFGGRLGNYAYLDMHQTIASALAFADTDLPRWVAA